jgi:hypothetical protein
MTKVVSSTNIKRMTTVFFTKVISSTNINRMAKVFFTKVISSTNINRMAKVFFTKVISSTDINRMAFFSNVERGLWYLTSLSTVFQLYHGGGNVPGRKNPPAACR